MRGDAASRQSPTLPHTLAHSMIACDKDGLPVKLTSMARHGGGVLIEELDNGAAAPAEVITDSDSDADEDILSGATAERAANQPLLSDDASAKSATFPPFSDAAPSAAAAEAAVQALTHVQVPPVATFADASGAPCTSASDTDAAAHWSAAAAALNRLADSIGGLSQPELSIDWGPSAQLAAVSPGEGAAPDRRPIIQEIAQDAPEAAPRLNAAAVLAACALFGADAALEVRLPYMRTRCPIACLVAGARRASALKQMMTQQRRRKCMIGTRHV